MKIQIGEDTWKVFLLDGDMFKKKFKEDLSGFADLKHKQIFLNHEELDMETIIHELVHAHYYYTCVNAASLDLDQTEEVFCELFAIKGAAILKQAKHIYNELKDVE